MARSRQGFWYRHRGAFARWLGLDLTHSQRRYAALLEELVPSGAAWLDLGCGRQLLPEWACDWERQRALARRARILIGLDMDPSLKEHNLIEALVYSDAQHLPIRTESLDLVTANVVVEHIEDPLALLHEIRRVLVPAGQFIFHTPNSHNYLVIIARLIPYPVRWRLTRLIEGRAEQDIFPTHYRLNSPVRIRRLARKSGLEVVRLQVVGSSGTFGNWGIAGWLELLATRIIGSGPLASNILCVLRKPARSTGADTERFGAAFSSTDGVAGGE